MVLGGNTLGKSSCCRRQTPLASAQWFQWSLVKKVPFFSPCLRVVGWDLIRSHKARKSRDSGLGHWSISRLRKMCVQLFTHLSNQKIVFRSSRSFWLVVEPLIPRVFNHWTHLHPKKHKIFNDEPVFWLVVIIESNPLRFSSLRKAWTRKTMYFLV